MNVSSVMTMGAMMSGNTGRLVRGTAMRGLGRTVSGRAKSVAVEEPEELDEAAPLPSAFRLGVE